jgi:UDP-N-acetyl-D-galactosamine dehydrogenase
MEQQKIAIIGLGYVGLPLAVEFAKKYAVVGFDILTERVQYLKNFTDNTLQVPAATLETALSKKENARNKARLFLTSDFEEIASANLYIVTVPTPIDTNKKPNLNPLKSATEMIAKVLKKGDLVIYESTVYPGCTEEECVPILEKSGLQYNQDFFCGYSPERINPGDSVNTLTKIKKVTSGSTPKAAEQVDRLYKSIITAGTHLAPSIKVAEASKAIENAQRDINISFVNELALMFDRMDIDTHDVIEAASTKWNFLPFKPGLVGGHCIGVDPYYLKYKAETLGYHPAVVSSGRNVNDKMGFFVGAKLIKLMLKEGLKINQSKILILGITFKENCPDTRNTKVIDIYQELKSYEAEVDVYDPWANKEQVKKDFDIDLKESIENEKYNGIVLAVGHREFKSLDFKDLSSEKVVIYDTKAIIDRSLVKGRL